MGKLGEDVLVDVVVPHEECEKCETELKSMGPLWIVKQILDRLVINSTSNFALKIIENLVDDFFRVDTIHRRGLG